MSHDSVHLKETNSIIWIRRFNSDSTNVFDFKRRSIRMQADREIKQLVLGMEEWKYCHLRSLPESVG